jgi:His/Glu/Gln/Arg/opine family amino acid ABC transporter permease subunit
LKGWDILDIQLILLQLLEGLWAAIQLFALTLLFSLPLGLLVATGRMSSFLPLQWLMKLYIAVLRGTPLMLQLMVVYFGPYYIFDVSLSGYSRLVASVIAFSINYAAYFGEIYRSGIQSIPPGQWEAAQVLGYSPPQTFFKIILPQMVKRVLPAVTNEVITLVKDTSLAFVIAYQELFTTAKQISAAKTTVMPLFLAGVFYFVFNIVVAWVMDRIESRMNYYQ